MPAPRVCVLRAPGTNCDAETAHAFELAGARVERLHLFRLLEEPRRLLPYQILCLPGGFSYGDDLGAGVIFSEHLRGQLHDVLQQFRQADTLLLGICNGFQVLLKAGLFEGDSSSDSADRRRTMTLTWNRSARYIDCWVRLDVAADHCVFLKDMDALEAPVAHAEGRLAVRDDAVLKDLLSRRAVALRYAAAPNGTDPSAAAPDDSGVLPPPVNPNGSVGNVAGLTDASGRVLGLMPHPERSLFATQHPQWTRRQLTGEGDGMKLFRNAVRYFG